MTETLLRTMETIEAVKTTCYHCGDSCPGSTIQVEDKVFCCEGCKMVFEILQEKDLCKYYDIQQTPGISLKGRRQEQYAYLDDSEVIAKLVDYSDGVKTRARFHLPNIHCASCIWLLENLYKLLPGVVSSKVNFPKKEIQVVFEESQTSLRSVVEILDSIGYAPAISLNDLESAPKRAVEKRLYYQLGIAGFAFGNIMLLSFPEYLGMEAETETQFQKLFGYLNIMLAIPVAFYSGWDYLKSAWLGIRHGNLNMDVPISLGILALFFRSFFEIILGLGAGYMDSLAGLLFFMLSGKWFQQTTFHHLSFERDYKSYFPIAATVRQGDEESSVPVNKLEVGQTIVVKNGELIPADGLLLKGQGQVDYSFVTGEAEPVAKAPGDKLFAGGRQMGERIELTLTRKVSQSYLTQLWNDQAFHKDTDSRTKKLADRVGNYFTWIILVISAGTLIYWGPRDWGIAINAFTAVLIVACPCAVALSVPFTFGNSIRILAQNRFYLKNIHVIEAMKAVTAVVFDKTGTITGATRGTVDYIGQTLAAEEKILLRTLVRQSAHPFSRQIESWLGVLEGEPCALTSFEELVGRGMQARCGGRTIRLGSAAWLDPSRTGTVLETDGEVRGHFVVQGRYREGLKEVVEKLRQRYLLYLLSGDNDREKAALTPVFGDPEALRFQQSPSDKLEFVKSLQAKGERVLMLGDGLNDAGALKQADTGIVIAEDTNNFTPSSDAIVHAGEFEKLPAFLAYARGNLKLVYGAYTLALVYNTIGLSFAVQGTLSPVIAAILMPASSVTIVLFGVLSSNLLARRLGLKAW